MPKSEFLYPMGVTYEQAAFGYDVDGKKQRAKVLLLLVVLFLK